MKTAYWIFIIVLLVGFGVFWFVMHPPVPANVVQVACGDRTVFRYNNPDDVFPEFIRNYEASYNVTSGLLETLSKDTGNSSVALQVSNKAQLLVSQLDQQNIFYRTTLKAYFIESNNDPCNEALRDKYLSFLNQMATDMMSLRGFVNEVTTSASAAQNNSSDTAHQVLAVVDTAHASVNTKVTSLNEVPNNKMVVLKNYDHLNSAISSLAERYKASGSLMRK